MKKATVVRECHDYSNSGGPWGTEKIGLCIDDEVYWFGSIVYPATGSETTRYAAKTELCNQLADAWNASRQEADRD